MSNYSGESGLQYHVQLKKGDVGRYVILPGDPNRSKLIASFFDDPVLVSSSREYVTYSGYLNNTKVSVCSTGIGGPSAAIAMEELVAVGAESFIRVGTCGAMDLDLIGGDIVIATGAVRNEGTSKEYAPIEFPAVANLDIINALVDSSKKLNLRHKVGIVQCKDSFYGQHDPSSKAIWYELENKWEAWKRLGVLASEMESAALFTVASYLKVRCGSVFVVVGNQEREALGLSNPINHNTEVAIEVAIEALKQLIATDK